MLLKKWCPLSRKQTRRLVLLLKDLILILAFLSLIIGIVFLFKGKTFKINKLTCQKEGFSCKKEAIFFEELRGQNIFLANTTKIPQKIKSQVLTIKEVKIKKRLPDEVLIEIIPRNSVAALTKDEKSWFLIDEDGFVFQKIFDKPKDLPVILINDPEVSFFIGGQVENEALIKTLSLLDQLRGNFIPFKQIALLEKETINVFLNEPIVASFSTKKSVALQVDSLQFILRQSKIEGKMPAFIDLRFNKPVIKY